MALGGQWPNLHKIHSIDQLLLHLYLLTFCPLYLLYVYLYPLKKDIAYTT